MCHRSHPHGQRCELCLSLSHPTLERTLVSDPNSDIIMCLKTLQSWYLRCSLLSSSCKTLVPGRRTFAAIGTWDGSGCHCAIFATSAGCAAAQTPLWHVVTVILVLGQRLPILYPPPPVYWCRPTTTVGRAPNLSPAIHAQSVYCTSMSCHAHISTAAPPP